ncbi:MAG: hypothetical protein GKR89_09000 [Candidatus Latescibacteria bacterium]|nr:hypothetical protein [Candidatus Latescibacterota bacterium]
MKVFALGAAWVVLLWGGAAAGLDLEAKLGVEYDDNPFEAVSGERAGWLNRLYLRTAGPLLETPRGVLQVQHKLGLKRFWMVEEMAGGRGDVMANQVEVAGMAQLQKRLLLQWGSQFKLKNVQRISNEQSYLHGGIHLGLEGGLRSGMVGGLRYRMGGDDARDAQLSDVSLQELGGELRYGRSRRFRARLGLNWRWLDYDRPRLVQSGAGFWERGQRKQADQRREITADVQVYRDVLVQTKYAFLDNHSNSLGYGYRAHRLQILLTRHIAGGLDGQLYFTSQLRRYDEPVPGDVKPVAAEEDEYEQTMVSVKMARQLNQRYGVSAQYRYSRNGSRQDEGFFRKNVYALSLDMGL